jgi:hypothetical protein
MKGAWIYAAIIELTRLTAWKISDAFDQQFKFLSGR